MFGNRELVRASIKVGGSGLVDTAFQVFEAQWVLVQISNPGAVVNKEKKEFPSALSAEAFATVSISLMVRLSILALAAMMDEFADSTPYSTDGSCPQASSSI